MKCVILALVSVAALGQENYLAKVIELKPAETVKAKQLLVALQREAKRVATAERDWGLVQRDLAEGHRDIFRPRYTADFKLVAGHQFTNESGLGRAAVVVSVGDAEQLRARRAYEELNVSRIALSEARKKVVNFGYQLASDHFPDLPRQERDNGWGEFVRVPMPWVNGIVFSEDGRYAISLQ